MIMQVPLRPYLIRAYYDWIVANNWTPYIVVNAELPNVQVPEEHIKQGRIVLNISPLACQGLHLKNERIVFSARFQGVASQLSFPPQAVIAIYARENNRGIMFGEEDPSPEDGGESPTPPPKAPKEDKSKADKKKKKESRSNLRVIK